MLAGTGPDVMRDGPDTVLFDLDNTLVPFLDPLDAWADAWAATAASEDIRSEVREALIEATLDGREDPGRGVEHAVDRFDLRAPRAQADAVAREAYREALSPYPGVCGLLAEIKQRDLAVGVVTDAPRERALHRLDATDLAPAFDVIVTRDDTPNGKEGPEPFEIALSVLEKAPEQAVMIGDWPAYDVLWPRRLGMRAVLAGWGADPDDPRTGTGAPPCPVAGSPSEVTGILFPASASRRSRAKRVAGQAAITAF